MVSVDRIYAGAMHGLHTEPRINAMKKKLVINVAPTGWFTNRQQNPKQPYTMQENVQAAIDAYKAGASIWHCHPRKDDGLPSTDPEVTYETIDRVLQVCPDYITSILAFSDYSKQGVGLLRPTVDLLTSRGPLYMQTCPLVVRASSVSEEFTVVVTRKLLTELVIYLEERGIKPEYQCDAYFSQRNIDEWLIKTGITRDPPLMNLMAGFHGYTFSSPASEDSSGYTYISMLLDQMPKSVVKGVCAGGRNWLPFTVFAIMLGVDMVRVGMEDAMYALPQKDELLQTPAQAVEMVVKIAEMLGREIATPKEAREILGLPPIASGATAERAAMA